MVCLPFLAYGQTATIVGTITDPSGAVVPNVTITVTHVETNRAITLTSNEAGQFVVPDIPIGHYNVKASATGFKVAERTGIVLDVSQRERIDFQLVLGTTAQSVSVEANVVAVQTDTGEVSSLVSGSQITELSTNGRSIYTYVSLTPGAASLMPDFQAPTPVGATAASALTATVPATTSICWTAAKTQTAAAPAARASCPPWMPSQRHRRWHRTIARTTAFLPAARSPRL